MISVYDLARKKIAVLQNAMSIKETQTLNGIYELSFDLPEDDEKNAFCQPFYYVRYEGKSELYRFTEHSIVNESTGFVTYYCEHVICTLIDNIMFGAYTIGNADVNTRAVLNWILGKQSVQNWVLSECDFDYEYEYGFEQENLLNALYSIPKPFVSAYKWTFNTAVYPWRISLKKIDASVYPQFYIRGQRNLLRSSEKTSSADICTRIYPLGYGEGVNQLTIKSVNNGVPYLEAPADVIAKYGIKEKVFVDRSYEQADSLKAYAQKLLNELSEPQFSRSFDIVDLYDLTNNDIDKIEAGRIVMLTDDQTKTYCTKTTKQLDAAGDMSIELSTKSTSIVDVLADLADRVRIESVYSQGATQLYQHSKDANAAPSKGMVLNLYFPKEMRMINKVLAKISLERFRAYSQATENSESSVQTSASGGGSTQTSSSGGGGTYGVTSGPSSKTTADYSDLDLMTGSARPTGIASSASVNISGSTSWGGGTQTSSVNGSGVHSHYVSGHSHSFSASGSHYHTLDMGYHAHTVYIRHSHGMDHTHKVSISIGAHSHNVSIPSHSHKVTIPAHKHAITPGIYEYGSANGASIFVRGKQTAVIESSFDGDITSWLLNDDGTIPRNSWIKVEIRPNDLAYVVASVFVQGFVQSRGGGTY